MLEDLPSGMKSAAHRLFIQSQGVEASFKGLHLASSVTMQTINQRDHP